jgi:glutathione S-transferase
MRPWLALKWGAIAFDEKIIPLGGEGYGRSQIKEIRDVSPNGRVPALHVGRHCHLRKPGDLRMGR